MAATAMQMESLGRIPISFMYKIVAINLGSSSTKFAYYEDDRCVFKTNIEHSNELLRKYPNVWDQFDFRREDILATMKQQGIKIPELAAIVTRGGHTVPLPGWVYRINELMLEQSASGKYGVHATDLGLKMASMFSAEGPVPLTVDPPVTDEFEPLARYAGLKEIQRHSSFHALNHRSTAKLHAKTIGRDYDKLNLIGVHMGGGISVCCHKQGKMVDATNGLVGDGPFSTNRTGTIPASALVKLCFSGTYTQETLMQKLNNAGLFSYLGESDVKTVIGMIESGDKNAEEVLMAMCYQIGKETAAMSAVLKGRVDGIYITGGIAFSELVTDWIKERVEHLAPVYLYPGEHEMESLALGAYDALRGIRPMQELKLPND